MKNFIFFLSHFDTKVIRYELNINHLKLFGHNFIEIFEIFDKLHVFPEDAFFAVEAMYGNDLPIVRFLMCYPKKLWLIIHASFCYVQIFAILIWLQYVIWLEKCSIGSSLQVGYTRFVLYYIILYIQPHKVKNKIINQIQYLIGWIEYMDAFQLVLNRKAFDKF